MRMDEEAWSMHIQKRKKTQELCRQYNPPAYALYICKNEATPVS